MKILLDALPSATVEGGGAATETPFLAFRRVWTVAVTSLAIQAALRCCQRSISCRSRATPMITMNSSTDAADPAPTR